MNLSSLFLLPEYTGLATVTHKTRDTLIAT